MNRTILKKLKKKLKMKIQYLKVINASTCSLLFARPEQNYKRRI